MAEVGKRYEISIVAGDKELTPVSTTLVEVSKKLNSRGLRLYTFRTDDGSNYSFESVDGMDFHYVRRGFQKLNMFAQIRPVV